MVDSIQREIDRRLSLGTQPVMTFVHHGITVKVLRRFCEGSYSRPGFFWATWWAADIGGNRYERSIEAWEPITNDDLDDVAAAVRRDAVTRIDWALDRLHQQEHGV